MVFAGQTSGSIASIPLENAGRILSWYLSNTSGGAIRVSVYVSDNGTGDSFLLYVNGALAADTTDKSDVPVIIPRNSAILIVASGQCDYYFNVE